MSSSPLPPDDDIIRDFIYYVKRNVNNSFDFQTWHQHQFGIPPARVAIKPELNFSVTYETPDHK